MFAQVRAYFDLEVPRPCRCARGAFRWFCFPDAWLFPQVTGLLRLEVFLLRRLQARQNRYRLEAVFAQARRHARSGLPELITIGAVRAACAGAFPGDPGAFLAAGVGNDGAVRLGLVSGAAAQV